MSNLKMLVIVIIFVIIIATIIIVVKVLVKSNNCVNVQYRCKEWKNVLHMFSFMAWRSWVVERRVTHKK